MKCIACPTAASNSKRVLLSIFTSWEVLKRYLKVCEELATHDGFLQHVEVGSVLEGCNQIDHEGGVTLCHHQLLTLHMFLDTNILNATPKNAKVRPEDYWWWANAFELC